MKLYCYWVEGSLSEGWIFAPSAKRAKELFIEKYGEQEICFVGKDDG